MTTTPPVTVSFGAADGYAVEESDDPTTVNVSGERGDGDGDPERGPGARRSSSRLSRSNQGTAPQTADYSGVPDSVTFSSGDTSETFTFSCHRGHG